MLTSFFFSLLLFCVLFYSPPIPSSQLCLALSLSVLALMYPFKQEMRANPCIEREGTHLQCTQEEAALPSSLLFVCFSFPSLFLFIHCHARWCPLRCCYVVLVWHMCLSLPPLLLCIYIPSLDAVVFYFVFLTFFPLPWRRLRFHSCVPPAPLPPFIPRVFLPLFR